MSSSITFLVILALLNVITAQPRKILLKVNLGGDPVGDFLGEEQVLDMSDFQKNVARTPIQNTDQPEIFQSQRFSRGEDFTIRIPVPDGIYSVTLLFAETYKKACVPGARVFGISLGTPISGLTKMVDSFDVFASAGCASAHGKRFDKVPSKNGIIVHLSMQAQHPSMCGFIVEGFPAPKGDGSEFKAIGQPPQQLQLSSPQSPSIPAFRPPAPPQMPVKPPRPAMAMPMQHMPAAPAPPFANAAMQAPPNYAVRRRLAGAGVADSYMGHGSYDFAEEADDESYST